MRKAPSDLCFGRHLGIRSLPHGSPKTGCPLIKTGSLLFEFEELESLLIELFEYICEAFQSRSRTGSGIFGQPRSNRVFIMVVSFVQTRARCFQLTDLFMSFADSPSAAFHKHRLVRSSSFRYLCTASLPGNPYGPSSINVLGFSSYKPLWAWHQHT